MCKGRFRTGAFLILRGPLGNLEEDSLRGHLRESKRVLDKWSVCHYGSSVRETWTEGTQKARSYQYPETGSKTVCKPLFDCKDQKSVL